MVDGTCDPLTEPITQDLRPLIHQNGIGADRILFLILFLNILINTMHIKATTKNIFIIEKQQQQKMPKKTNSKREE